MNIKSVLGAVSVSFITMSFSSISEAALFDRGGGLIYDDALDITWLQDASYAKTSGYDSDGRMIWSDAVTWADQLAYGGFDDWRLPHTLPVNGSSYDMSGSFDGSTDNAYNITSPNSEMAHLYYVTLGNSGYYDTNGVFQIEFEDKNWGPFSGVVWGEYWSSTDDGGEGAWLFVMADGWQTTGYNQDDRYTWAVHDGDIGAVPIPSAVWLFGSGLLGLIGIARRKKT